MTTKILVPVDGSENAKHALQTAMTLASAYESPLIILLNVQLSLESVHTKMFFSKNEIESYLTELGEGILVSYLPLLEGSGISYEKSIQIGDPKHEIIQAANEMEVDHIVMGARGLGPIKGKILGSVSFWVLHHTRCPVTIVPS